MKRKTKIVTIVAGSVVALGLLTVTGLKTYNKLAKPTKSSNNQYQVYKVASALPLTMSGKIVAEKTQALNAPTGKLQQLNVTDGQTVKNGDILLTVTVTDIQESISSQQDVVNKANRAVNSAAATLKNAQQSYNQADVDTKPSLKDTVTQAQQAVTDANGDLQDAQSKLAELQGKLTMSLKAPFDGVVSVSNNTKDGIPSITINSSQKVLQANVSEYDYSKVKTGDTVTVSGIDGSPKQTTKISKIEQIPTGQGKGTTYYPFSANMNNDFLYGQSVKVKVPQSELKIPKSAVYKGSIYKVIDGKASRAQADLTKNGDTYIVNAGVSIGEKLITNPDSKLTNGEVVND
ncbi:RND transporter MFP subunit [Leuconostoc litchii]|uniref:Biotin/lipoyl-binding protein n=1 Tax=Leuconostoc litchii TaxID=1981069 RepID=A0A6P2CLA1_9LACO|nr:biotin/lipoyl-binding protein [Leuconostoc litchii]TYC46048.1 biotin/lipoyl-binding protein [Leuconostoc litchii]GMA69876.1 RND transporter MFP subunit [Leuconostoc litchii]